MGPAHFNEAAALLPRKFTGPGLRRSVILLAVAETCSRRRCNCQSSIAKADIAKVRFPDSEDSLPAIAHVRLFHSCDGDGSPDSDHWTAAAPAGWSGRSPPPPMSASFMSSTATEVSRICAGCSSTDLAPLGAIPDLPPDDRPCGIFPAPRTHSLARGITGAGLACQGKHCCRHNKTSRPANRRDFG